jgi:FlaA1/EpsC-like NDP-sugar epimerase
MTAIWDVLGLRVIAAVSHLPRSVKALIAICADALCVSVALWTAISLKLGSTEHPLLADAWLYVAATLVTVPVFASLGLYRAVVRFLAPQATLWMLAGVVLSGTFLLLLSRWGMVTPLGTSTICIYAAIALLYVTGSRLTIRYLLRGRGRRYDRVAIYGAGDAGVQLATALLGSGRLRPVLFVDDNASLHGAVIHGLKVVGSTQLAEWRDRLGIQRVLLAMPALSPRRRQEILARLAPLRLPVQTVPGIADLLSGAARVDDVGEVEVNDILGRQPVPPHQKLLEHCIRDKSVAVTGAGGSIGSELCRQILCLGPTRLILLEMSEVALYRIERELRIMAQKEELAVEIVPLLGNAQHQHRMRDIFNGFGVQTVYHAAAYKHVPIVEENMIEGLYNNVLATWRVAEAAREAEVGTFVLISTDKAVNPTSVMGATKRVAEIVLQGLQQRASNTRFCMVRFGNVLESSGSVVPLFRDQIRRGGPVTVTHPEVMRYFMTIPEAAQLVLQAGAMAEGGDVFVLDMGQPIRIVDLARRMIELSGLSVRDERNSTGDIEIKFTGLRAGEKLFEELLIGKNVTATRHPMIMRAVEHALGWDEVIGLLNELVVCVRTYDCRAARGILHRAVREYQPTTDIRDLVWETQDPYPPAHGRPVDGEGKVTELHPRRARGPTVSARDH